jgi:hypothetical protein
MGGFFAAKELIFKTKNLSVENTEFAVSVAELISLLTMKRPREHVEPAARIP